MIEESSISTTDSKDDQLDAHSIEKDSTDTKIEGAVIEESSILVQLTANTTNQMHTVLKKTALTQK